MAWFSLAHLELARGNSKEALRIADRLVSTTPNVEAEGLRAIPYLAHLRGQSLSALRRYDEAEACLREGTEGALGLGFYPILWRTEMALGQTYKAWGRRDDARSLFERSRGTAGLLAGKIPLDEMRSKFLRGVEARIPSPVRTPRQSLKLEFGGLTAREQEVAARIAKGMINRAIAEDMVVGERTIEKHVENILGKLGFSTRSQIAAWVAERGLTHRNV
jgi:DNA-binding CsgD family transcriptional regulator